VIGFLREATQFRKSVMWLSLEIAGSQSVSGPANAGLAVPVSKSFIARISTANTNVLKLQFTGSSSNNRLLANTGVGTTKPSVSLTVIRIQ
jgi:hypothetical protein